MSTDTQQPPGPDHQFEAKKLPFFKYKCFLPDCPFASANDLEFESHIACHTDDYPYICVVCGMGHRDCLSLVNHQNESHPNTLYLDHSGQLAPERWFRPRNARLDAYMRIALQLYDEHAAGLLHIEPLENAFEFAKVETTGGITVVTWLTPRRPARPRHPVLQRITPALPFVHPNGTPTSNAQNASATAAPYATASNTPIPTMAYNHPAALRDPRLLYHSANGAAYPTPPLSVSPSTPGLNAGARGSVGPSSAPSVRPSTAAPVVAPRPEHARAPVLLGPLQGVPCGAPPHVQAPAPVQAQAPVRVPVQAPVQTPAQAPAPGAVQAPAPALAQGQGRSGGQGQSVPARVGSAMPPPAVAQAPAQVQTSAQVRAQTQAQAQAQALVMGATSVPRKNADAQPRSSGSGKAKPSTPAPEVRGAVQTHGQAQAQVQGHAQGSRQAQGQVQGPRQAQGQGQGQAQAQGRGRGGSKNDRAGGSSQQVPQMPPPATPAASAQLAAPGPSAQATSSAPPPPQKQGKQAKKKGKGKAKESAPEQAQTVQPPPSQAPHPPQQPQLEPQTQQRPRKRRRADSDIETNENNENPYPRLDVGGASGSNVAQPSNGVTDTPADSLKDVSGISDLPETSFTNLHVESSASNAATRSSGESTYPVVNVGNYGTTNTNNHIPTDYSIPVAATAHAGANTHVANNAANGNGPNTYSVVNTLKTGDIPNDYVFNFNYLNSLPPGYFHPNNISPTPDGGNSSHQDSVPADQGHTADPQSQPAHDPNQPNSNAQYNPNSQHIPPQHIMPIASGSSSVPQTLTFDNFNGTPLRVYTAEEIDKMDKYLDKTFESWGGGIDFTDEFANPANSEDPPADDGSGDAQSG